MSNIIKFDLTSESEDSIRTLKLGTGIIHDWQGSNCQHFSDFANRIMFSPFCIPIMQLPDLLLKRIEIRTFFAICPINTQINSSQIDFVSFKKLGVVKDSIQISTNHICIWPRRESDFRSIIINIHTPILGF